MSAPISTPRSAGFRRRRTATAPRSGNASSNACARRNRRARQQRPRDSAQGERDERTICVRNADPSRSSARRLISRRRKRPLRTLTIVIDAGVNAHRRFGGASRSYVDPDAPRAPELEDMNLCRQGDARAAAITAIRPSTCAGIAHGRKPTTVRRCRVTYRARAGIAAIAIRPHETRRTVDMTTVAQPAVRRRSTLSRRRWPHPASARIAGTNSRLRYRQRGRFHLPARKWAGIMPR